MNNFFSNLKGRITSKRLLITTGSLIATSLTASASSPYIDNWYVSGTGGLTWHSDTTFQSETVKSKRSLHSGGVGTLALGIEINCWRIEIEGSYRKNRYRSLNLMFSGVATESLLFGYNRDIAVMSNVYRDIPLVDDFGIYLGGGLGASFNKIKTTSPSASKVKDTLFAWQFMGGGYYGINECITLTLGYRLFVTERLKTVAGLTSKRYPLTHSVEGGIRFKF